MTARKLLKIILPLIAIGLSTAIAQYLINSQEQKRQPELKEKVWQVNVIQASRQSQAPNITLYGRVESPEQLQAAAPGASIVQQINVRSGDSVTKGEVLVSLDRRDFESQLIQANSEIGDLQSQISELKIRHATNLASLKTERDLLQLAENDVKRMRKLKNQNLGSDSTLSDALNTLGRQQLSFQNRQLEVDIFPSRLKMLKSRHQQFEAKYQIAKLMIERSKVVAPFDAMINSVPVSVGDRVATGQTLISLYPVQSLEIRAHIPYSHIADIQTAMTGGESIWAEIKRGAETLQFDLIRLSGDATATGIDAFFDTGTASIELRSGEFLTLTLSLPVQSNVIAIPFQAIYGNSRIYLKRDDRLVAIDVDAVGQFQTDGILGETRLLVRSDKIIDGDLIVTTHLPNAISGLKVRTVDNDKAK